MIFTFDIDGTLLKFGGASRVHPEAFQKAFSEMFEPIPLPEQYLGKRLEGLTDQALAKLMIEKYGVYPSAELLKKFQKVVEAHYLRMATQSADLCPGVKEFLQELKERGITTVLATGNYQKIAQRKMELAGLDQFFPNEVGGFGELESRKDVILSALQNAQTFYQKTFNFKVHFGDAPSDAVAAKDAGFESIILKTGRPAEFPQFGLQVQDLVIGKNEILEYVQTQQ